jgi:hypothetical protein
VLKGWIQFDYVESPVGVGPDGLGRSFVAGIGCTAQILQLGWDLDHQKWDRRSISEG